jgi:thymidylate synthase (FAD)
MTKRPTSAQAEEILNRYFPVLDYGFVALKDYMGVDESAAEAARTSYQQGTVKRGTDGDLIRYLDRHDHGTPFEFVTFKFHCQMPIFVARQWIRHRMCGFNEMSGRYSLMPLMFYTPEQEHFAGQSQSNKQGRSELLAGGYDRHVEKWERLRVELSQHYQEMTDTDVARELARIDLPLSTYTNWYWVINARSLFNFLRLRCDEHAQWEIRQYARTIAGMLQHAWPILFQAWFDYEYAAITFSRLDCILLGRFIQTGQTPSMEMALGLGMSKREWDEFVEKARFKPRDNNFQLDIAGALPGEHFEALAKRYTPGNK